MKGLLLRAHFVGRTTNMKISRCRLADYVKICTKKHAARAARLFFLFQPIKSLIFGVVVEPTRHICEAFLLENNTANNLTPVQFETRKREKRKEDLES